MNSMNPKTEEENLKIMSTTVTLDPFQGLRLFEDPVTGLISELRTSRQTARTKRVKVAIQQSRAA
jgi:hypothetical protein